jgi:pimeloyl-ACP methyl ester carboxylesterase
MRILFHSHIIRARLIAASLFLVLRGPAAEPSPANAVLEDTEANLAKSIQGYKVGDPARYRDVFTPLSSECAALSPDGKHLAYTVRNGNEVHLHIIETEHPERLMVRVLILEIDAVLAHHGLPPVRWLRWVSASHVVAETSRYFPITTDRYARGFFGEIIAVSVDGSEARVLANPRKIHEINSGRAIPADIRVAGLHPGMPDTLAIAAHSRIAYSAGRGAARNFIAAGAYAINAVTGGQTLLTHNNTEMHEALLLDGNGSGRIRVDRLDFTVRQPLWLQPAGDSEEAIPLDQATGLKGFAYDLATVLGERSVPLGFDAKGNVLYYASNNSQDAYGIYALNLDTKQRLPGSFESPSIDLFSPGMGTFDAFQFYSLPDNSDESPDRKWRRRLSSSQLVMDRFTHKLAGVRYEGATRTAIWLRPELQAVQERLAAERPGRSAEILEWDESLNRFLVREQGPADAGAFFIFDRQKGTYTQFVSRSTESEKDSIAQLTPFDFKLADGSRIEGLLALPKDSKVKKIPLVLLCPDYPWQRRGASYQPEFEALTRMGFAVALYNGRGAWGTGLRERQKLQGDYVSMQTNDVVAVADHLASKFDNVSRRSVALFGQGHGGYVALRALQLHPQRFRAAVTVDAWLHGNVFFDAIVQAKPLKGSREKVTRPTPTPVTKQPELIKAPVFTIVEFSESPRFHANTALYRAVKRNAPDSELLVHTDRFAPQPQRLARQWARTESFLNYVLYTFSVRLGELEILPDEAKPRQP